MGAEAPYMYHRASAKPTDRPFNPKAATQASWTPKPTRPKHTGPLIDSKEMNRHPDSYFVVPYGNLDWKPMSPRTKMKVKWSRYLQLLLRVCALLGASGLLVCVICVRPTGSSTDWIIRVPPGIAILHCVYAIYHLSRSSKARTPASSASYHIFSSIMDAGLVPFLAFTALMAYRQRLEPIQEADGDSNRWRTLFGSEFATEKVVLSTFLIGTTNGGMHVVSLCISIYLAMMFRKISQLPPDMNPLEDNLTKRTRSHKRNKSSLSTLLTESTGKRESQMSESLDDSPGRAVPFMHTRNDSSSSFSSPPRARADSRTDLPSQIYYQPVSQQSSRSDLRRSPERSPKRSSRLAQSEISSSHSRPTSAHMTPQRQSLLKEPATENWFVHASPTSSPERYDTPPLPFNEAPPEFRHLRVANQTQDRFAPPSSVLSHEGNDYPAPGYKYDFSHTPKPLEMNPPTPPVNSKFRQNREKFEKRALQDVAGNSASSSPMTWEEQAHVPKQSFQDGRRDGYGQGVNGKGRFYGSLRDSLRVGRKSQRVVSSGVDVNEAGGTLRGREVSGKVAEEGRAF